MSHRLQLRRDTYENWIKYNPMLMEGEPAFETDTHRMKIGDGIHTYSELEYEIGVGNISNELVSNIPSYNVEIEFDNDIIELKETYEEGEYITFRVITPGDSELYEVLGVKVYSTDGRREANVQPTENTNEFKLPLTEFGHVISGITITSDKITLNFKVSLANQNDGLLMHINKFVNLYNFREVYVGQCSEQRFTNKVFSGPLRKFGYVPEPKLNHFKSDVQILGNLDMTYIEEDYDDLNVAAVPQYLMFALRLRNISDDTFNTIRVKSNGFTIPFVDTGALIVNASTSFPIHPELGTFAYRVFRSSVPMVLEEVIENLEVEFCKV